MLPHHIIKQDDELSFYIYQIKFQDHLQTGFLAVANIRDFIDNRIKGHELTSQSRLDERADQMLNIETQVGPIYVSYIDESELDNLIMDLTKHSPEYEFESFDKTHHTLWCIQNPDQVNQLSRSINNIDSLYIADGHHRMGAMKKISEYYNNKNTQSKGNESYNYFMIAAFPKSQSKIFDYNRVIKDLNGLSVSEFIKKIENFYNEHNIQCKIFDFDFNIAELISKSDLAISRSGSSTIAELEFLQVPFIAIPYPFAMDNHQYENALYYKSKNTCWILEQKNFTSNNLSLLLLEIFNNNNDLKVKRKKMFYDRKTNTLDKIKKEILI